MENEFEEVENLKKEVESLKNQCNNLKCECDKINKENHDLKSELLASRHKDEIKEKSVEEMTYDEKNEFLINYFNNLGDR